jgi:hypothetical protein
MPDNQIPHLVVPVLHALAKSGEPVSFADLKEQTGIAQASLSRMLNNLCSYGYAMKASHGQYMAGPELLDMGISITRNRIVPELKKQLIGLKRKTQLNAEIYIITQNGPVYLTHSPAKGEEPLPFRFGHLISNRTDHPAALFFLAMHGGAKPAGCKENFIVDRGGQWPELFRAASMVNGSNYCLALSGMIASVGEDRYPELKEALHEAGKEIELP